MAENKTDQIFRNVPSLISKNVAKTRKLHKSNSLLHKTSNLNVNSQSLRTDRTPQISKFFSNSSSSSLSLSLEAASDPS